jgi:hypothetical protein
MYKDVHCESSAQGCLDLPSLALDTRFPAGMTMIVYNDGQGAPESFAKSGWVRQSLTGAGSAGRTANYLAVDRFYRNLKAYFGAHLESVACAWKS